MSIKEIIQKIDNQANELDISNFQKWIEVDIDNFFKEKWTMYKEAQKFNMQVISRQIHLPTGNKGKQYNFSFNLDNIGVAEVESFELIDLPEGVVYDTVEKTITGVPTTAGDHKVLLRCFSHNHRYVGEKSLTLTVVPDPKDLWKNIPTPTDIEFYKEDCESKFYRREVPENSSTPKTMIAASQRGRSHAHEGTPRDDDFALHFDDDTKWYIMAVADGAGSAKYSRRGAQLACNTAVGLCAKQLAKDGISEILDLAIFEYNKNSCEKTRSDLYKALHSEVLAKAAWASFQEINAEASKKQCVAKDYATTLKLSICKEFDFGWFIGAFWVGDGGIGVYNKEKQILKILGEPDGGEFAGQTRFLTMPEIFSDRPRTRFEIVEDFTALILMTDGVTDPKFETDANLNKIEKWNDLWDDLNGANEDIVKVDFSYDNEQADKELLKWLDFWSKGNHDDRTIAILY